MPEILDFEFYWKSPRDRIGFVNCLDLHMYHCATVNASNFQVLVSSGRRVSTSRTFICFFVPPANTSRFHGKIRVPQQTSTATANEGNQDTGRFYRSVAAATHMHRQPIALLFVVVIRSSYYKQTTTTTTTTKQQHHNKKYGAASRIADCNTRPNIRAPAPRFDHARNPTLNSIARDIDRGNLEPPC